MTTDVELALRALLDFRLTEWNGLPGCLTADVARVLGAPSAAENVYLGAYPALREIYAVADSASTGLAVYSRAQRPIAVETLAPPPLETADALGEPDRACRASLRSPATGCASISTCTAGSC